MYAVYGYMGICRAFVAKNWGEGQSSWEIVMRRILTCGFVLGPPAYRNSHMTHIDPQGN